MKEQIEARLRELHEQFNAGQMAMTEIDRKQEELRATLLRIGGAIQVLEELLGKSREQAPASDSH